MSRKQEKQRTFKVLTMGDNIQIEALHAAGKSFTEIGKLLQIDKSTVSRHLTRILETGSYVRKEGSGRKRKTTPHEDRLIIREVKRGRFSSAKDIKANLPQLDVSEQTIRRRITQDSEFKSYWCTKTPFISEKNRKKRVEWARDHLSWTTEQWHKVLWSDESPYVLRFQGKKRVWRSHNEKYAPWCTQATVKHDEKIMVWGCFAAHGVGHLYLIDGIMRKEQYLSILDNEMFPSAMVLFSDLDYVYQEDNDPKHTAKVVKEWYREHGIDRMDWPAQSPDLNPIENLWSILDRRLKDRVPNTKAELFEELKQGWNMLDTDLLTRLVDSMPRRCQAVIDANGYATKY